MRPRFGPRSGSVTDTMRDSRGSPATGHGTLFARLARHRGGNTLAIAAAALIPLAGMVGGGVDMSRLWLTKTRMQHGCDAAVLAGRKQMGGGAWTTASAAAADQFFRANFATGSYGSTDLSTQFSESGGKVSGVVSATVPLTLMRVLGLTSKSVSVRCDAEMRLPNTDVMFVLDTTGSMADPAPNDTQSKISGLRNAVKCFYEILAKLPTNGVCTAAKPSGGTTGAQIRFGFVPYATNVNVGYLLPTAYVADRWPYQSREPVFDETVVYTYPSYSDSPAPGSDDTTTTSNPNAGTSNYTLFGRPTCTPSAPTTTRNVTTSDSAVTTNGGTKSYTTTTVTQIVTTTYTSTLVLGFLSAWCQIGTTTTTQTITDKVNHTAQGVPTTIRTFKQWRYDSIDTDISALKNGTLWNSSLTLPIGPAGTPKLITWRGCIEERKTVSGTDFTTIPSNAKDLDIDTPPIPGDRTTMWAPALPDLIFTRKGYGSSTSGWSRDPVTNTEEYGNGSYFACPAPARKLQSWGDPLQFDTYVDGLQPEGNTYHDIGLLWGARLMSPTGIFASENARTPQGGDIERHMIFMTDGDTVTRAMDYAAYGVPWFDRRNVANPASATSSMNDEVNARFAALCTAVKNKNITLWVISFGGGTNTTTENRLKACASSNNYYFKAADSSALQTAFSSIANQISQLRLTK